MYLTMNEQDRELLSEGQDFMGPTLLAALSTVKAMDRLSLCMVCPAAQWYQTDDDMFVAFCTVFHRTMFDHTKRIIVSCDAREDAIRKLEVLDGTR